MIDHDVFTVLAEVIPGRGNVIQFDVSTPPKRFAGVTEGHVADIQVGGVAESLGVQHHGITHGEMVGVPNTGVSALLECTVADGDVVGIPERVFPLEQRVVDGEVAAVLQRRFAIPEGTICNVGVVGLKECPFTG